MPGFPDCKGCDFANRPETCHAVASGHKRYCQLVEDGRCDYRALIWERTTDTPRPFDCPDHTPPSPTITRDTSGPVPLVFAPSSDGVPTEISFAVVKCPHRTKEPNCGCAGKWRCSRDDADVTFQQCVQCKTRELNEAQP